MVRIASLHFPSTTSKGLVSENGVLFFLDLSVVIHIGLIDTGMYFHFRYEMKAYKRKIGSRCYKNMTDDTLKLTVYEMK